MTHLNLELSSLEDYEKEGIMYLVVDKTCGKVIKPYKSLKYANERMKKNDNYIIIDLGKAKEEIKKDENIDEVVEEPQVVSKIKEKNIEKPKIATKDTKKEKKRCFLRRLFRK